MPGPFWQGCCAGPRTGTTAAPAGGVGWRPRCRAGSTVPAPPTATPTAATQGKEVDYFRRSLIVQRQLRQLPPPTAAFAQSKLQEARSKKLSVHVRASELPQGVQKARRQLHTQSGFEFDATPVEHHCTSACFSKASPARCVAGRLGSSPGSTSLQQMQARSPLNPIGSSPASASCGTAPHAALRAAAAADLRVRTSPRSPPGCWRAALPRTAQSAPPPCLWGQQLTSGTAC